MFATLLLAVTDADDDEYDANLGGVQESTTNVIAASHPSIASTHIFAWRIAGMFAFTATLFSLYQIRLHLRYNSYRALRTYILRILLMVPIYALESWLGLRFKETSIYFDTMRQCYEALVIYSFYCFLVHYLGGERRLVMTLREKDQIPHVFPFNCLTNWRMGVEYAYYTKIGILQFVVLKPAMALTVFVLEWGNLYWTGEFSWWTGYPYVMIVDNISQTIALYCLFMFYFSVKQELAPVKPVPKFLVVKMVVFFTFWQSVALSILVAVGAIRPSNSGFYSTEDVEAGIQDFLVCVEMFAAAVGTHYAFPHLEFHNPDHEESLFAQPVLMSLAKAVDYRDVFVRDVGHAMNPEESELNEDSENEPLLSYKSPPHGPNRTHR